MKKLVIALFAVLMLLSLCACGEDDSAVDMLPVSATEFETAPTIMAVSEEEMTEGQFTEVYTVGDSEYDSYIYYFDQDVTDIQICAVEYDDEITQTYSEPLFELPLLKVGEGLRIKREIPELLPCTCIFYTDTNAEVHGVLIANNGKDGGVAFIDEAMG